VCVYSLRALVIRIILSSVVILALPYFSIFSNKQGSFFFGGGGELLNVNFVFSLQLLSATFLILRRIQRDIIVNDIGCHVKDPLFL